MKSRSPRERPPEKPGFRRELNVYNATLSGLGTIIGAGIFVVVGVAAGFGGPSIILAFLVAAGVAALNAIASVELGIVIPIAGGAYEFGRRTISPLVGFIAGWLFMFAGVTASAAFALTFASYLKPILPLLPVRVVSVAVAVIATAVNYLGITLSIKVNNALVFIKVAVLLFFVAVASFGFSAKNFTPFFAGGWTGFLTTSALLFFAYTGYGRPVTVVEEVDKPETTLPKAISYELIISTVLYLAVAVTGVGAIGGAGLAATSAPLFLASAKVSRIAATIVAVGGLLAGMSVILAEIFGLARVLFAMARGGDFPSWLNYIHREYAVPTRAVLVVGLAIIILSFYVGLGALIASSSLLLLIYYVINDLAALRLGAKALYSPVFPALGAIFSIVLVTALTPGAVISTAVIIVTAIIYFLMRWRTFNPPVGRG